METYHFRSYTIVLFLDIFVDAEARLRDGCGKDILIVSFSVEWRSVVGFRKTYSSIRFLLENCRNERDVLLHALSPEYTAVFGIFVH